MGGGAEIQVAPPSGRWIQNSEAPKKRCDLHLMNIQVGVEIIKVDDATQRK